MSNIPEIASLPANKVVGLIPADFLKSGVRRYPTPLRNPTWSKRADMNRERPSAPAKKRQRRPLPAPKPPRLRPFPISWDEWEKAAAAGDEIIRAQLERLKRGEAEIARRDADGRWP
jgi:hypothetical protein